AAVEEGGCVVKLRVDYVFAFRIDITEAVAELDSGQALAEWRGAVELRIDNELARAVHVTPFAEPNIGQATGERTGALELRVDDEVAGAVHKAPTATDLDWKENSRGGSEQRDENGQAEKQSVFFHR